jgi:histidinol-phosphate aminotransferase
MCVKSGSLKPCGICKENKIRLDRNENPYGLPPSPKEEIRSLVGDLDLNRFPEHRNEGLCSLMAATWGVEETDVIAAAMATDLALAAFGAAKPGDRALLSGSGSRWAGILRALGYDCRFVPFALDGEGFRFETERFLDALSALSPRAVVLQSPDDPTGVAIPPETLRQLALLSPGLTLIDESFVEFSRYDSVLSDSPLPPATLVVRSLAHAWGLAGINLIGAVGDPETTRRLRTSPILSAPDSAAAGIASQLLSTYGEWMESRVYSIRYLREAFAQQLSSLPGIRALSGEGNFIPVLTVRSPEEYESALAAAGVLVAPLALPDVPGGFRITIGREGELQACLSAMKSVAETGERSRESVIAA